ERFFGFFEGEAHQFGPALACDNHIVEQPYSYEEGYHLTEDLVDRAIRMVDDLRAVDPDKPFFCWFCTGACHSPHHSPKAWRERYRGRFDQGGDRWREETLARQKAMGLVPERTRLSERPPWVPAWDELSDGERRPSPRYTEVLSPSPS